MFIDGEYHIAFPSTSLASKTSFTTLNQSVLAERSALEISILQSTPLKSVVGAGPTAPLPF